MEQQRLEREKRFERVSQYAAEGYNPAFDDILELRKNHPMLFPNLLTRRESSKNTPAIK